MPTNSVLDRSLIPGVRGGLSPAQIWNMIRARWRFILALVAVLFVLALLASLLLPKVYEAKAVMLIDFESNDPVAGERYASNLASSYIATQIDLLKSQRVRLAVVKRLGWADSPKVKAEYADDPEALADLPDRLAGRLKNNLKIETTSDSRFISLLYTADDPELAAQVTNAWIRSYQDEQSKLSSDPASSRRIRYTERLKELRQTVDQAQQELTAKQQKLGIINVDDKPDDLGEHRLANMNVKLNDLRVQRDAAQAKLQRIRDLRRSGQPMTAQAEILDSRYVQTLKGRLVELEAQRDDLGENLGPRHPSMQAINAQIATVRDRLQGEIDSHVQAIRGDARTASERVNALQSELARQHADVLEIGRKRDEIAPYLRQLQSAQTIYKSALDQYNSVVSGSALRQNNISVVNWAEPPSAPASPNLKLNLLAALVLGGGIGVVLAFLLELVDRRVRSSEDVTRELELPVLGELQR